MLNGKCKSFFFVYTHCSSHHIQKSVKFGCISVQSTIFRVWTIDKSLSEAFFIHIYEQEIASIHASTYLRNCAALGFHAMDESSLLPCKSQGVRHRNTRKEKTKRINTKHVYIHIKQVTIDSMISTEWLYSILKTVASAWTHCFPLTSLSLSLSLPSSVSVCGIHI